MKNKQNAMSGLKYQLRNKKQKGERSLVLKLNSDQRDFVESLGYEVRPHLYKVQTRMFEPYRRRDSLLKRIHFASKKGIRYLYLKLSEEDVKILQDCGLFVARFKDEVILNH